ncbi:MAG: hypothetical protein ACOX0A_07480 [Thermoguttaceae bacterium]|jgi:hypothetical protein
MNKRRIAYSYSRRTRSKEERLEDGQDSFLDVVSNLVGVLIILIMVAGARVRNAAEAVADPTLAQAMATASDDLKTPEERQAEEEYVAAVDELEKLSNEVQALQRAMSETSARAQALERQADAAELEYRRLIQLSAELDAAFEGESLRRSAEEKEKFDLQSAIFDKEKRADDLRREKEALVAARPQATVLENIPTPVSQRVAEGHEGFFCLKRGRISHVPINEFQERVMLKYKNFRGDMTPRDMEEKIGPVDNYVFQYNLRLSTQRTGDGISYYFEFQYGECIPANDMIGEPVDEALANRNSVFRNRLLKYLRDDTTITIFVYPDSYGYLNDVKKFLFSLGYMTAFRPLPDGAPIALSPHGTASSTY